MIKHRGVEPAIFLREGYTYYEIDKAGTTADNYARASPRQCQVHPTCLIILVERKSCTAVENKYQKYYPFSNPLCQKKGNDREEL